MSELITTAKPRRYNLRKGIVKQYDNYEDTVIMSNETWQMYIDEIKWLRADRPTLTEDVRVALMRLTMCAREECSICKYVNDCSYDRQCEMATENMHTILNALTKGEKT